MNVLIKARQLLDTLSCPALLITDPLDIFYLTGIALTVGTLLLSRNNAILFVDGRYKEAASQSQLIVADVETLPTTLVAIEGPCAFDSDHVTYAQYLSLLIKKNTLFPLASPIKRLRQIKEQEELEKLRVAAALCMRGMEKVMSILREGISEKEVANEVEFFWKKEGGEKFSFDPIIAFGANSSKPHHRSSDAILRTGDIVLVDMGVVVSHYHSDMTRVFGFGNVDKKLVEIYAIVYEAKKRAIAGCIAGRAIKEVDALARDYITECGYGEAFVHGLGHGIGLETHEPPYLRKTVTTCLEENQVVTIEPGIYIPGLGGVRLEDMVIVQKNKSLNLTPQFDFPEMRIL